jgi:hypothetical protein
MSQPGQYYRRTPSGKTLAYVYRYRGFWHVTVYAAGDLAEEYSVRTSYRTLNGAKSAAEGIYIEMTRDLIRRRANKH